LVICSLIFLLAATTAIHRFTSNKISGSILHEHISTANNRTRPTDVKGLMQLGEILARAQNQSTAAYEEVKMQLLQRAYNLMHECLEPLQLEDIQSVRKMLDPIIYNYKLVLDLDVACAFNYKVDEIIRMYANASVKINPSMFKSGYPAVHYSIAHMKLDMFKFLLESGADISALRDHKGRTLLDLIVERYSNGQIKEKELRNIYRAVKRSMGAPVIALFDYHVFLREICDKLSYSDNGELVILSREESAKYREVMHPFTYIYYANFTHK
jgi:hypothetical protein